MSNGPELETILTPQIEREVTIRRGSTDWIVWGDTFTGLYHVPPVEIQPESVLDLGANIGLTAAHFRYLWPEASIAAVELDAANAVLGRKNAPGVRWRVLGVAPESGVGHYDDGAAPYAMKLGLEGKAVETCCLDDLILDEFDGPADFVKMDVEGEEWALFRVAEHWAPLVRSLLVELHPIPVRGPDGDLVEAAIERLEEVGFTAVRHERHPVSVWAVR